MQKDQSTLATQPFSMDDVVGNLFQTAVLLLGDERAAAMVVEQVVADAAVDPCADLNFSAYELMDQIIAGSLTRLRMKSDGALDAPHEGSSPGMCIDSDDLSASGISSEQLHALVEGPGRGKLRQWLEQLSPCLRGVFVLRAIVGRDNESTSAILLANGAKGWTGSQVSLIYRQALCSLATSLVNLSSAYLVS